jgi:predicted transcriptional regulator
MPLNAPQLLNIQAEVKQGRKPTATVRELLQWFGVKRRGSYVVEQVRQALKETNLETVPDFGYEYIDSTVHFVSRDQGGLSGDGGQAAAPEATPQAMLTTAGGASTPVAALARQDPAYRVRKLAAANRPPLAITSDKPIAEAVTIMLVHDFSQLPVMQGERKVLGMVSWKSLGSRLATGASCTKVSEAMEPVTVVSSEASIFQVAEIISRQEIVLVQASTTDTRITGILTSADLAEQFGELGEPFLLLGEIENHVRELLDGKYDVKELADVRDPSDSGRIVEHVSDLTFGEYVRLLEKPERWEKCFKHLDRGVFVEQLKEVRDIRNDVMHFDPDGIGEEDVETLRRFATFLQKLLKLAAQAG